MKKLFIPAVLLFVSLFGRAQANLWKFETEASVSALRKDTSRLIIPQIYRTLSLPFEQYKVLLNTAPPESLTAPNKGLLISLPYPDNSFKNFRIVETKMMEEALSSKFLQIKTYVGQGVDDPAAIVRLDYTAQGFHAYVRSPSGLLFIDPYQKGNNNLYITYFSKDYLDPAKENFKCRLDALVELNTSASVTSSPLAGICIGTQLKTYRTAISCTGEYARAVCPPGNISVANTLSAIVTTMNRVNGVYQTDLDIRMILVGANASIVFIDSVADPYEGNNDASTLLNESQEVIDSAIGNANYDIGHTFSTGEGGLANLSVVCKSEKAKGVTGLPKPSGDPYDIDFVAHEIGHEFGGTHTFESELGNCSGNRARSSAYEVGSGSTIMAYAGICETDNLQFHSDPYFHSRSFDQIVAYTTTGSGNSCAAISSTGNHSPIVVMPVSGIKIPKETPFTLSGLATDEDGDAITYCWEEWDITSLNNGSAWNSGDTSTSAPLFKSRSPKVSGSRTFPDMAVILANYPQDPSPSMGGLKGETLPGVARDIKFRLVARDNNAAGGGVATGGSGCSSPAEFKVVVTDDGPFTVTSPNMLVNWIGGSTHVVTWNVAGTNAASRINVQSVDILMSTDGGLTYPTTIASDVPNDGTKSITVPNIPTNTTVRFMIKAIGNIFFDISDVNFTITFNSVLPVSLLRFSAEPRQNAVILNWSTATEANSKGFIVLRSAGNSNNFVQIGFIKAAGNSSTVQNYTFTDINVKQDVVYYYRLREIDNNNAGVYSDIKRARLGSAETLTASVQPLPFRNSADVYLNGMEKKDFKIIVTDIAGRIIQNKQVKNTQESRLIPLDFSNRFAGIYFIKIEQNNLTITLKAVKQ